MLRVLTVATMLLLVQAGGSTRNGTLHIRAALGAAGGPATPIARHLLLISDNPASAPPRRIYTGPDGAADVSLKPGNYTVESDQPVTIGGRAYQWIQVVDIVPGGETTLELSAANAEVAAAAPEGVATVEPAPGAPASGPGGDTSASALATWQNSVVGLWSPTAHGTGFLVDASGLIATSQRVIGEAKTVEIQIDEATKVAATVLVSDAGQDVAVIAADPAALAGVRVVPVTCAGATSRLAEDQEIVAVAAPRRGGRVAAVGAIDEIAGRMIDTDLSLPAGSGGAPAFGPGGELIGITTPEDGDSAISNRYWRVVRIEAACGVIAGAADSRRTAPVPAPDRLPVETLPTVAGEALAAAVKDRAGALAAYTMSTSDFDVAFITPPLIYAAREVARGERRTRGRPPEPKSLVEPLTDFANWTDYVEEDHAVLFVRATPKLVESFWATVGRYAAQTQGVSLPAFKHLTSSFSRLQAFCGDKEVAPLHPFTLEQRLNEREAVFEGFYAFAPDALGPQCGTVKLTLYSEKDPGKGDTKTVEPAILEKIRQDFAAIGLGR